MDEKKRGSLLKTRDSPMVFQLLFSQDMERESLYMKKLIGLLAIGIAVLVSQPVIAQLRLPGDPQQRQEDRDDYLQGLADGRMGTAPSPPPALDLNDPLKALRNSGRQNPYQQGYNDGERDQQRDDRE